MGGGPAGLSAAVAAGRMNRRTVCFEAGTPRTAHAPRYHNYLGFPDGLSGRELLRLGREQAVKWCTEVRDAAVRSVERRGASGEFLVRADDATVVVRGLIFATGIEDRQPACGNLYSEMGVHYCVVCDAYETRGQRVAVIGHDERAMEMLGALRDFTTDLHLLLDGQRGEPSADAERDLVAWGVEVRPQRLQGYACTPAGVRFAFAGGAEALYPHVFVALGSRPRTTLARDLGCRLDEEGFIVTDELQATSVPFVYAAGDCDGGHKQVTQAMAEGELAALGLARLLRETSGPALGA